MVTLQESIEKYASYKKIFRSVDFTDKINYENTYEQHRVYFSISNGIVVDQMFKKYI